MAITMTVNGVKQPVEVTPGTPLLWVLRDHLGLTGTKFGCGVAQCGACTVHVNGLPRRACVTPIEAVANGEVTTIEGVAGPEADAIRTRLASDRRAAVRLLSIGSDHVGDRAAASQADPKRRRYRSGDERQSLPLRHLRADSPRHQDRSKGDQIMSQPALDRGSGRPADGAVGSGPVKPRQRRVIVPIRYPATALRLCRYR